MPDPQDIDLSNSGLIDEDALARESNTGKYTRDWKYYLRSNVGNFTQNFVGNADRWNNAKDAGDVIEAFTPNAIPMLYTVADAASQLVQHGAHAANQYIQGINPNFQSPVDEKPFKPVRLPGARTAERMVQETTDKINKTYNIETPESTEDVVFGVVPQLAVPGPKLPTATTALGKTAHTVASLTMPLAQSKPLSLGHLVEGTIPLGLMEGAAAVTDQPRDQYDSAFRKYELPPLPPLAQNGDLDLSAMINPDSLHDQPYGPNEQSDDRTFAAYGAAGATLLTAVGLIAAKRMNLFHPGRQLNPINLAGEMETQEALGPGTYAKKAVLDTIAPIVDAGKKIGLGKQELKNLEANASAALNPVARSNITTTAIETGVFPGMGGARIPALSRIQRAVGKLAPDKAHLVDNMLISLDTESRMQPGQVIIDGKGNQWSRGDFLQYIHNGMRDPEVARIVAQVRDWYDGMRRVAVSNGIITQADALKWEKLHPYYIHTQLNKKPTDGLIAQALHATDHVPEVLTPDAAMVAALSNRAYNPQHGVLPGQGVSPIALMHTYAERMTQAVQVNNFKREFHDLIMTHTNNTGGGLITPTKKTEGENIMSHFDASGKLVHYRVNDQALHTTMMNQPLMVVPVMNAARSMVHFFATGAGNPFFVPSSIAYDTAVAPLLRMTGDSLGPLDEIVRKMTNGKYDISNSIGWDPTSLLNAPIGTTRYLYGALVKEMTNTLASSVEANSILSRTLDALGMDRAAQQHLVTVLNDAYMRSTHFAFESSGGGANMATTATPEHARATLSRTAPELLDHLERNETSAPNPVAWMKREAAKVQGTRLWRTYSALMNALHSGVKFQAFASNNYTIAGETVAAKSQRIRNAAKSARELTVDPSRSGDNAVYRTYASSAAYGNVGVQALYQTARAMRDHPWRFATSMAAIGTAYMAHLNNFFQNNPQAAAYYYQTLTPQQRVQAGIPLYVDDRGDVVYAPADPIYRPMMSMMSELYGALMHHTDPMSRDDEQVGMLTRAFNDMFDTHITEKQEADITSGGVGALVQALPGADIPAVNLLARQMGVTPQNNFLSYAAQRGEMYRPEQDSRISPDDERTVRSAVPKFLENIMTEVLGQAGRNTVNVTNAFARTLKATGEPLTALDAAIAEKMQQFKDYGRGKPMQFLYPKQTNDKKIDTYNEITRRNIGAFKGMDEISKWGEKGWNSAGTTGGPMPMSLPGTRVDITNQPIATLYSMVQQFKNNPAVMKVRGMIRSYQAVLEDVENSPLLSLRQDDKRARVNQLKMLILEQQHILGDAIQRFEDSASKQMGRTIRLDGIQPDDFVNDDAIYQKPPLPPQ